MFFIFLIHFSLNCCVIAVTAFNNRIRTEWSGWLSISIEFVYHLFLYNIFVIGCSYHRRCRVHENIVNRVRFICTYVFSQFALICMLLFLLQWCTVLASYYVLTYSYIWFVYFYVRSIYLMWNTVLTYVKLTMLFPNYLSTGLSNIYYSIIPKWNHLTPVSPPTSYLCHCFNIAQYISSSRFAWIVSR